MEYCLTKWCLEIKEPSHLFNSEYKLTNYDPELKSPINQLKGYTKNQAIKNIPIERSTMVRWGNTAGLIGLAYRFICSTNIASWKAEIEGSNKSLNKTETNNQCDKLSRSPFPTLSTIIMGRCLRYSTDSTKNLLTILEPNKEKTWKRRIG